ncbi:MAG: DUF502 domain-containing protein, partial [Longimicrobiales bacterium]
MAATDGGMARAFRRHLIAGLVVIAPVGVTVFVLLWIFQWLDSILGRFLYPTIGRSIPGLGILLLLVLLLVVGWLAERALGARLLALWNGWLERIPFARRVYNASNRIVRTVFTGQRAAFREVVMIEYPSDGRWQIGFVAADAPGASRSRVGEKAVTVFVPTTPNPTSGWIVVVPRTRVIPLGMSVEEAFTYILSAGSVVPADIPGATPPAQPPPAAGPRD